jgi:N-hydroxyarylamine O-acetyltransferase
MGYRGPTRPSVGGLRSLHKKHLLSIPFENLDIHLGRPIILSQDAFFEKIITHRRGGFCYELNGSFAALLTSLGFKVRMLSARVARKNGGFTPEFDHMTLMVTMKDCWLADVGFGESFTEPKRLDFEGPQPDNGRVYRITRRAGGRLLSRWNGEKNLWEPQYLFSLRPRSLGDFVRRCRYQQTSPNSHFKKNRVCTLLTQNGRVTLTDTKFIVTRGRRRFERAVRSPKEFNRLLQARFGIKLRLVASHDEVSEPTRFFDSMNNV